MFKYKYRKYWILSILLILAILTTIAYRFIESRWLEFRNAEKDFNEGRYSKSIEFYLKALEKKLDPKFYITQLVSAAKITGTYEAIVEIYSKTIQKNRKNDEIVKSFAVN
ncbi:MAG: hypothetical protein K1060chlam1_00568 [Candidatus Anoxychlamydiales bacterium]|nr:hypothetical protein [Candidatus Anoxychlamydiales bacterium]